MAWTRRARVDARAQTEAQHRVAQHPSRHLSRTSPISSGLSKSLLHQSQNAILILEKLYQKYSVREIEVESTRDTPRPSLGHR